MLKVSHISKNYDEVKALDDVSFEVKEGEIFGLLGVNGAGKTTTFRIIIGLLKPDSGKITLDGKKIDYSITDKIGFLPEERSLLTKMTVKEQILYYGALKSIPRETILKRLDEWLTRLDIKEYKEKPIRELSKGNQQKIQFIASVINNPKLLILDEPFTGLDPFNVKTFMTILKEIKKAGTIIIFSSHRMEHVELFCDRLLILVKGKTILTGKLQEIKESFPKKNIYIKGKVDVDKIKKIEGVEELTEKEGEYRISISNKKVKDKIFNIVKESDEIDKFMLEDKNLNDIFVSKVGDYFDK